MNNVVYCVEAAQYSSRENVIAVCAPVTGPEKFKMLKKELTEK